MWDWVYMGQTVRNFIIRYEDHINGIRSNEDKSRYALHILQQNHEYGPTDQTMKVLKLANKIKYFNIICTFIKQPNVKRSWTNSTLVNPVYCSHFFFPRLHQTVLGWHVVSTSNPTAAQPAQGSSEPVAPRIYLLLFITVRTCSEIQERLVCWLPWDAASGITTLGLDSSSPPPTRQWTQLATVVIKYDCDTTKRRIPQVWLESRGPRGEASM
jgi:hypothetical protein